MDKEDVEDVISYIQRYPSETIELKFNKKLSVLFIKTGEFSLMKILNKNKINQFKNNNITATTPSIELYTILKLMYMSMNEYSELTFSLQYQDRPVMMTCEGVSACISCLK